MNLFPYGHASHPQWRVAADSVLAQVGAQMAGKRHAQTPTLALLYVTDHYASSAQDLLDYLRTELPQISDWAGTVGVGIAANNIEYFDEPGLALMLCDLPSDQYRVFSGVAPLGSGFEAHTALVHADPGTPELDELIDEMSRRTASRYLFGGLSSGRGKLLQFAVTGNVSGQGAAGGIFSGGLSGVAFDERTSLVSRVTQGCLPVAGAHRVSAVAEHVVQGLDNEPALDVLLRDLQVSLAQPEQALRAVRSTLIGVAQPARADNAPVIGRSGNFGSDVLVRHIIGLDPAKRALAISDRLEVGMQLAFCRRNAQAAKADLMRICAEIREELEPEELPLSALATPGIAHTESASRPARRIVGAIYISCSGRGGPHFGGPSAELHIVRRALGDVPLVGFFASGEIARSQLYGYTGVLTAFTTQD